MVVVDNTNFQEKEKDILELVNSFILDKNNTYTFSFDTETILSNLEKLAFSLDGLILLEEGKGIFVAVAIPSLFFNGTQVQELCFFVKKEHRTKKLADTFLEAYEYWCTEFIKADYCFLSCLDKRVGNFYKRKGYQEKETSYFKNLKGTN